MTEYVCAKHVIVANSYPKQPTIKGVAIRFITMTPFAVSICVSRCEPGPGLRACALQQRLELRFGEANFAADDAARGRACR